MFAVDGLANNNRAIIDSINSNYFGVDNDSVLDYRRAR